MGHTPYRPIRPPQLVVTNVLYAYADKIEHEPEWADAHGPSGISETAARDILHNIATTAPVDVIWRLLGAIQAPASQEELLRQLRTIQQGIGRRPYGIDSGTTTVS